jgi:hypothetical protein
MITTENTTQDLSAVLAAIGSKARIGYGDCQRLRRELVAGGIATRAEAEALVCLDRRIGRADPAWTALLVATIVDYVVWTERPTGRIPEATAQWLATILTGPNAPLPATARLILREIAEEAEAFENEALGTLSAAAPQARANARRGVPAAALAAAA